jgi:predicted transcriptional regulator of viral defense system|nr:LysR family transcriptional regulator [uncultured Oscillibacter sp.]
MAAAKTQTAPAQNKMITVEEVMDILQVSRSAAYHVMQRLNKELREKGYITHSGRIPRSYLMDRCGLQ